MGGREERQYLFIMDEVVRHSNEEDGPGSQQVGLSTKRADRTE